MQTGPAGAATAARCSSSRPARTRSTVLAATARNHVRLVRRSSGTERPTSPGEHGMLTMYSTTWCGYCHRLRSQLDREGIGYRMVDIERDPTAAEFVMGVNGGNQTVPTVRFADGSTLTNPTINQVKQQLGAIS